MSKRPYNRSNAGPQAYRTDGYSTISTRVVLAIADETETDIDALPTLYETINPEALDQLVESATDRTISVTFEYYDHRITVTGDGDIDVRPL
ncbi:HalOD1 output domain-containing protein [Halomontanus rarus]|uniref:HalOD1 output domain-containing protein n=1 Tax=Halomontanus rarus TaxID=3034020 RepID=UPI001A98AEA9